MPNRREFIKMGGASAAAFYLSSRLRWLQKAYAQGPNNPNGTLVPTTIPKYQMPLVKPPKLPRDGKINMQGMKNAEY